MVEWAKSCRLAVTPLVSKFEREGVVLMVSWTELFSFCLVIIGVISLVKKGK